MTTTQKKEREAPRLNVADWSTKQVLSWALSLPGISEDHAQLLEHHQITGLALLAMTNVKLSLCGIPFGPATALMQAIEDLQERAKKKSKIETGNLNLRPAIFLTYSVKLVPSLACDGQVSFVDTHHFRLAGLGLPDQRRLFVRDEWSNVWPQLNDATSNLCLFGPPGIGKSSLLWAWCCFFGASKEIRWIHIPSAGLWVTVDFSNGRMSQFIFNQETTLIQFVDKSSQEILVIDGVTEELKSTLMEHIGEREKTYPNSRFILSSSMEFFLTSDTEDALNIRSVFLPGWTLDEYKKALSDKQFLDTVRHNLDADPDATEAAEQIEAKYFFAGASARWMFSRNTLNVQRAIHNWLEKIARLGDLPGRRSSMAANHIFTSFSFTDRALLVSQFVTRLLSQRCKEQFVIQATRHARWIQNPVFDGWIFEMDFLFSLRSLLGTNNPLSFENTCEKWEFRRILEFDHETDLGTPGNPYITDSCWLLPKKFNQGCCTFQIVGQELRVVYVTAALSGSFKLQYVTKILAILKSLGKTISAVNLVVVVPPENVNWFKIGKLEGYATDMAKLWKTPDPVVFGFKRANGLRR